MIQYLYMLYRMWSKLCVGLFIACAFLFVGGTQSAIAECRIEKVSFDKPHTFFQDTSDATPVPFYEGFGKTSSLKKVIIATNSDPSCDGMPVYLTIFSSTRKSDPSVPTSPDKHLTNVKNKQFKIQKSGGGLNPGDPASYGITVSFRMGEEACFDYNVNNLKTMIQNSIAAGTSKQSDYEYLNAPGTQTLYNILFDNSGLFDTLSTEEQWAMKKIVYRKFNKSVDCGYYARARLGTEMDVNTLTDETGQPVARLVSPDDYNNNNFVGFMCDYNVGIFCDPNKNWEYKNAYETSAGTFDPSDKCIGKGAGCYELLAPIPGLGDTINFETGPNGEPAFALEQFFTAGINVVIGAVSVLAVLALMYYGFKMMQDRSAGRPMELKVDRQRILQVFYGIGIILGSYVILNTINPDLLVIAPDLQSVTFESKGFLSDTDFTKITGAPKLTKTQYDELGDKIAAEVGIDRCLMRVILVQESGGNPTAIGCDENVRSNDVPSRRAFVQSLLMYDGTPIPAGTGVMSKVFNVVQKCKPDASKPGLGVDWRFSKGIGLMQLTAFPQNYNKPGYLEAVRGPNGALWNKRTIPVDYRIDIGSTHKSYSPIELLKPEVNLRAGAELFKAYLDKCNGSVLGAFTSYATGGCTTKSRGRYAYTEPRIRTQMYNDCKAGKLP